MYTCGEKKTRLYFDECNKRVTGHRVHIYTENLETRYLNWKAVVDTYLSNSHCTQCIKQGQQSIKFSKHMRLTPHIERQRTCAKRKLLPQKSWCAFRTLASWCNRTIWVEWVEAKMCKILNNVYLKGALVWRQLGCAWCKRRVYLRIIEW